MEKMFGSQSFLDFFFLNNEIHFIFFIGYSLLCMDFSLIVASRGYSLVTVPRLLTAVASLVAEHRL